MPPKTKQKKQKLTKAEKLKIQQEEERRLCEEEEARLEAERELERLEREKKEREIERLHLKDLERRDDELNELCHLLEENQTAITKWKSNAMEAAKWERYLSCDDAPDPNEQREVNTFISLWRDDPEVDIMRVLKQRCVALRLVEELEGLFREATDLKMSQIYQEGLVNLQELIHLKHRLAVEEILKRANENIDIETGNMHTVVKDEKITLCLWANLKKSPSCKGFNFEEVGLSFELPKQLAVSDVAVQILHTCYDHLSMLSRMSHPRKYTTSRRSPANDGEVLKDSSVQQVAEGDDVQQQGAIKEVQSIQGSEVRKRSDSQESRKSRKSSSQPSDGRRSQILTQIEAVEAEALIVPQLTVTGQDVQEVDLMEYTPLGGVFYYQIFHLPPQSYKAGNWEMQQVLDTGLEVFPYPTEKSCLDDDDAYTCPPVGVSLTLPDGVVFFEPPRVARWVAADKQWRLDRITDVSYEETESKISFKMETFQPFVLMQKTYNNFPFRSWELQPRGQDSAVFTVNGPLFNLSITIQDDRCMMELEQERGPSHLVGKWMSRPALQEAMINSGINIFVNEFTQDYISISKKDPRTERAAYEQMALFASACAFSHSKWNAECGAEHLVLQACEHNTGPVPEGSWSLYLLDAQRSQKLEITETSATFSSDLYSGSEFHSTFIHMLQDNMGPDGIAKTRKSHYLFVDTVQSLLCATRPLVYS